jgi:hypothetical protein
VAQWITRLPTEQKIAGSIPAWIEFLKINLKNIFLYIELVDQIKIYCLNCCLNFPFLFCEIKLFKRSFRSDVVFKSAGVLQQSISHPFDYALSQRFSTCGTQRNAMCYAKHLSFENQCICLKNFKF